MLRLLRSSDRPPWISASASEACLRPLLNSWRSCYQAHCGTMQTGLCPVQMGLIGTRAPQSCWFSCGGLGMPHLKLKYLRLMFILDTP